jgi:hypothetical protein
MIPTQNEKRTQGCALEHSTAGLGGHAQGAASPRVPTARSAADDMLALDELGNYVEAEQGFCSSRLRKSRSVTPSSAGHRATRCAICTFGWRPSLTPGRFPSGRTRELERDGGELPLFAFAEVALDKAALHKHRLPRCVRSGHPAAARNDGPIAPPPDDREQRVCRQGRDDRYAWPSDNGVIEVAAVPRSGPCPCNT